MGVSPLSGHGSNLSRVGASRNPRAVHARIHALRDSVGQHSTRLCSHEMLSVLVARSQRNLSSQYSAQRSSCGTGHTSLLPRQRLSTDSILCRPLQALAITLDREPPALPSTRNRLRTAVQGCVLKPRCADDARKHRHRRRPPASVPAGQPRCSGPGWT